MSKNIKIAIYTGLVPSTTFIERLIQGLAKKGLHIYLFGYQNKNTASIKNTYYVTYKNRISKLFILIKYSFLLTILKRKDKKKLDEFILGQNKNESHLKIKYYPVLYHRPDIFHLQWAKSIEEWLWVQDFGIKLILSLRGTHITISPIGNDYWKNIYKQYFPGIDGFHAVSKSMISIVKDFGVDTNKIKIVKSGLNLEKLSFNLKIKKNPKLSIISIGRSHWTKGYAYALDAMKLLVKDNIDFNYTIVGVENDEELIYKRYDLGLTDKILFKKKLPNSEILQKIIDADVLLLSSVEEGIANVVLEAMALGTFVVTTNCGGMNEVVLNNKNGLLVPSRNPEAIAFAIRKVSEIPIDEYRIMTKAARETIESEHEEDTMILKMNELYHSVLKII